MWRSIHGKWFRTCALPDLEFPICHGGASEQSDETRGEGWKTHLGWEIICEVVESVVDEGLGGLMGWMVEKEKWKFVSYILNHDQLGRGYRTLEARGPWMIVARNSLEGRYRRNTVCWCRTIDDWWLSGILQLTTKRHGMMFTCLQYTFPASHNIGKRPSAYELVPFLMMNITNPRLLECWNSVSGSRWLVCFDSSENAGYSDARDQRVLSYWLSPIQRAIKS